MDRSSLAELNVRNVRTARSYFVPVASRRTRLSELYRLGAHRRPRYRLSRWLGLEVQASGTRISNQTAKR